MIELPRTGVLVGSLQPNGLSHKLAVALQQILSTIALAQAAR